MNAMELSAAHKGAEPTPKETDGCKGNYPFC